MALLAMDSIYLKWCCLVPEIVTKVAISQWLLNALSVMNWKSHVRPWVENTISLSLIMTPDNDGAIQKYHSVDSELSELPWCKTNLDGSDTGAFFFVERHIGLSVLFLEGLITATWGNKSAPAPLEKKPLGSQLNPCWQKSVAMESQFYTAVPSSIHQFLNHLGSAPYVCTP